MNQSGQGQPGQDPLSLPCYQGNRGDTTFGFGQRIIKCMDQYVASVGNMTDHKMVAEPGGIPPFQFIPALRDAGDHPMVLFPGEFNGGADLLIATHQHPVTALQQVGPYQCEFHGILFNGEEYMVLLLIDQDKLQGTVAAVGKQGKKAVCGFLEELDAHQYEERVGAVRR